MPRHFLRRKTSHCIAISVRQLHEVREVTEIGHFWAWLPLFTVSLGLSDNRRCLFCLFPLVTYSELIFMAGFYLKPKSVIRTHKRDKQITKPRRGLLCDNPGLRRRSTPGVCHLSCKHSGRVPSRNALMMIAGSLPGSLLVWPMSEGALRDPRLSQRCPLRGTKMICNYFEPIRYPAHVFLMNFLG